MTVLLSAETGGRARSSRAFPKNRTLFTLLLHAALVWRSVPVPGLSVFVDPPCQARHRSAPTESAKKKTTQNNVQHKINFSYIPEDVHMQICACPVESADAKTYHSVVAAVAKITHSFSFFRPRVPYHYIDWQRPPCTSKLCAERKPSHTCRRFYLDHRRLLASVRIDVDPVCLTGDP